MNPVLANAGTAAAVSVLYSCIELACSLTKPYVFRWRPVGWTSLRFGADVTTSLVALFWIVPGIVQDDWAAGIGPAILAGVAGPSLFRVQLATMKLGREVGALGPGRLYIRLRKKFDHEIDNYGAIFQTNWIMREVLPQLRLVSMDELETTSHFYINSLDRLSGKDKREHTRFITRVCKDDRSSADLKRKTVVQRLLEVGGRRMIEKIVNNPAGVVG